MSQRASLASAEFETLVEKAIQHFPGTLSDAQREIIRENLQFQFEFPSEYVVYLEQWEGDENACPFVRREVLFHHASMEKVQEFIATHPQACLLRIHFVEDPDDPEPMVFDPEEDDNESSSSKKMTS